MRPSWALSQSLSRGWGVGWDMGGPGPALSSLLCDRETQQRGRGYAVLPQAWPEAPAVPSRGSRVPSLMLSAHAGRGVTDQSWALPTANHPAEEDPDPASLSLPPHLTLFPLTAHLPSFPLGRRGEVLQLQQLVQD